MKIDPFPGALTKQRKKYTTAYVLTPEQEAWLRRWFPEVENARLMKASGLSHSTLHRITREMGLKKSEKGMQGIKRRQAAHIKRLCERNGYYDSLRGRKPSEACRQATARMWQEIREGLREHPARIMKRTNPRKYKKWMENKSLERSKTIRRETLRALYGMQRQTRLKCIVLCKYTRSQTSHRYNALKRGYFVMADCSEQGGERYNIYYDENTERSTIFERNLMKDGFKILQYS